MNRLIPTFLFVFLVVQVQVINGAKPRFAPKYCLRFKFDCTSPEKKGHVCCLFPLPIEGNDLGEQSSVRESGTHYRICWQCKCLQTSIVMFILSIPKCTERYVIGNTLTFFLFY